MRFLGRLFFLFFYFLIFIFKILIFFKLFIKIFIFKIFIIKVLITLFSRSSRSRLSSLRSWLSGRFLSR